MILIELLTSTGWVQDKSKSCLVVVMMRRIYYFLCVLNVRPLHYGIYTKIYFQGQRVILFHNDTPPPNSNVQGTRMRIPIFSGKGVFWGRLSRERFSLEKHKKGHFINLNSRDMGYFSQASQKIKKKGTV